MRADAAGDFGTVYSSLDERCRGGAVVKLNVIHASAIGLGACALAALVVPAILLRGLGVNDASIAVEGVIRLSGVSLLALACVLWSARFWLLSPLGASTLRTLAVIYGIGAVMLLAQQIAAARLLESAIPIVYMSLVALEYAGSARRYSKRFGAA
jgi:hypothetical protein